MKPSEVIREARNVLFERGWYQGGLNGPDGSLCIVGALSVAARSAFNSHLDAAYAVQDALPQGGGIGQWNDARDRTFGEVVEVLDRAEKLALIAEESDA